MRRPHLSAALLVFVLLLAALAAAGAYFSSVEDQYVRALAPEWMLQKVRGAALARSAFRQPDLLPVYGASELGFPDPYHASKIFEKYPTGFTIFPIGDAAIEPVTIMQEVASIGPELRGKKVVVTLSPDFALEPSESPGAYAHSFSALHACNLAFSTDLSLPWKQAAARRMLEYPKTLKKLPLIRFAVAQLANGSPLALAGYYASFPLGRLQCAVLDLQDHGVVQEILMGRADLKTAVAKKVKPIDWDSLLDAAQNDYAARSNNNPFGFENIIWDETYGGQPPKALDGWSDKVFNKMMSKTKGWGDLELLLRELRELGAEPLLFSAPLNATYFGYYGISADARHAYHEKLRATVKPYGVYLIDLEDRENDNDFLIDGMFHLSSVGWVTYAQTLDAFYHDTLGVGK